MGNSRINKGNKWSSGPPQLSRSAKSPQGNSSSNAGASTAGNPHASRAAQSSTRDAANGSRSFSAIASANNNINNSSGGGSNGIKASGNSTGASNAWTSRTRLQDTSVSSESALEGQGLIEGEAADQVEAMNQRLLFILSYLVGGEVSVVTQSGQVFSGVLDSINPNDAQSIVLRYAYDQSAGKSARPVDTLVINGKDCLSISGSATLAEQSVQDPSHGGFKTDTDISRTGGQGSERELHRWVPDDGVDMGGLESGFEGSAKAGESWDQFATNEKLFGLTTDFDEEIYTTKLDRTRADYKEREREAIRIAQEIQNAPYLNSHVAEERQEIVADDGTMDEEDKYGAVLRPSGAPGKYVPPYLRGKMDSSAKHDAASVAKQPSSNESSQSRSTSVTPSNKNTGQPASASPAPAAAAAVPVAPAATASPNNAVAAAALAKLNIRMTGHSAAQAGNDSSSSSPVSKTVAAQPALAGDPAITALSKPTSSQASSNNGNNGSNSNNSNLLANLRGNKHRTDAAALNKPMADITEKLNSERERMQQQKQALRQARMSELKEFQKSFKLKTPMPEDLAEIIGYKKKPSAQSTNSSMSGESAEDTSSNTDTSKGTSSQTVAAAKAVESPEAKSTPKPKAPSKAQTQTHIQTQTQTQTQTKPEAKAEPKARSAEVTPAKSSDPPKQETPAAEQKPETSRQDEAPKQPASEKETPNKQGPAIKKTPPAKQPTATKQSDSDSVKAAEKRASSFKFNAKASSFKPSVTASPFVPKIGSRASSAASGEFNPFFGRRVLKRAPLALWGGAFRLGKSSGTTAGNGSSADNAPTWPFGTRTYRSQFVSDEPDAVMYQQQAYMHQYGYGYYHPYQYPPQMPMMPPGVAPRMPATSAYSPGYGAGPYTSTPAYSSPIMVGDGRSPVMGAMGAPPPTGHPLSHMQPGVSVAASAPMASTPEMGQAMLPHGHIARSGSGAESPNVMYTQPPGPQVHMGMVPPPPHMPFGGMQPGAYMGPPPPQGYAPQQMPVPMGYGQYPPGMVMMHGASHPEQHAQGSHHSPYNMKGN
ncbi:poly(A)-binding protein binding protein [Coemansia sp. RSA 486]|nr:poly(A)-binding protein binding protein [Coemansia sp. RSA 486]